MSRKEQIIEAAVELFAENGYSETPTSAVAKKAGVAEGLIFHHFKNKPGILLSILKQTLDDYVEKAGQAARDAPTGLDAVEALIRFHFAFATEKSREARVLIRDMPPSLFQKDSQFGKHITNGLTHITDQMAQCIKQGQKDGSINDISPEDAAFLVRALLDGAMRLKIVVPGSRPGPDIVENAVRFCRASLKA